ncbi:hypothetical protein [Streptomyces sp. NBC_01314]|uniref:SCO2400 family protein n=1 Tax=Streptomyces sp. NBC_01314 TaxID=2903821 RepID=UPI003090A2DA|nr:hypothetical protein OG622_23940 [Streptomyces sp. NBC_01314]
MCPGCGAYAPDIAPATIDSRVAPSRPTGTTTGSVMVPLPTATWGYGATDGSWLDGTVADGTATEGFAGDGFTSEGFAGDGFTADGFAGDGFTADGPTFGGKDVEVDAKANADADAVAITGMGMGVDVDVEGVPAVPRGRAARRRQVARWKKNQRRAVVATAVALVGGGLTVLGMDRQSTDRTQAATAPDAESLGAVEEQGSQRGRTPTTETDDARRTSDTPATTWSPSGDTSRDRSAADRADSRANHPNSPRTASATPSAKQARTGSSTDGTATDTATLTDETTTPPATDGSGSSADTGTSTGSDTGTGTDTGAESGSGTGSGTGTGTSDGSGSDTATTSPSGLCLLGIVCVS